MNDITRQLAEAVEGLMQGSRRTGQSWGRIAMPTDAAMDAAESALAAYRKQAEQGMFDRLTKHAKRGFDIQYRPKGHGAHWPGEWRVVLHFGSKWNLPALTGYGATYEEAEAAALNHPDLVESNARLDAIVKAYSQRIKWMQGTPAMDSLESLQQISEAAQRHAPDMAQQFKALLIGDSITGPGGTVSVQGRGLTQDEIASVMQAAPAAEPTKCAQCKKPYKHAAGSKGCPKCAPGLVVPESEFQKPPSGELPPLPALPQPDTSTDPHYPGYGDPAYRMSTVEALQEAWTDWASAALASKQAVPMKPAQVASLLAKVDAAHVTTPLDALTLIVREVEAFHNIKD